MPQKKLDDGTTYVKATYWKGEALKGNWVITRKIDGVRAMRNKDGNVVSRNGKPLYNLDHLQFEDAEIFRKDWETTVSLVRSLQWPDEPIMQHEVYELDQPEFGYDERLHLCVVTNPTEAQIDRLLKEQLELGHEGLVMRQGDKWKKVVPELFADVRITGWYEGKTGKNIGKFGGFTTNYGNVGTGFTEEFRSMEHSHFDNLVGTIMQVGYREKTPAGKLRFPRFERMRYDKNEESID